MCLMTFPHHLFPTLDSRQINLHPKPLKRGQAWFASHNVLWFHLLPTTPGGPHLGLEKIENFTTIIYWDDLPSL